MKEQVQIICVKICIKYSHRETYFFLLVEMSEHVRSINQSHLHPYSSYLLCES